MAPAPAARTTQAGFGGKREVKAENFREKRQNFTVTAK